jgi:hypothetical protein
MKGVRVTRPIWTVYRNVRTEYGEDGAGEFGDFWDEAEAVATRDRLTAENEDDRYRFYVVRAEATVVYPEDEQPPWIDDPDRLKNRGWEPESYS